MYQGFQLEVNEMDILFLGQYFEDELVEGEKTYNPWALKCHRENLIKIGINVFEVRYLSFLGLLKEDIL